VFGATLAAWGETPKAKLQAPSSKLQKNTKIQTSKGATAFWILKVGAFLELGAWCLVFLCRAFASLALVKGVELR
jgi:hypothetical protein